jgi:hypothetical protein
MLIHTDTVDIELNLGAQELVPFVDGMDQIATTIEGASAAKGMREGCIGCKVGIDRFSLLRERWKSVICLKRWSSMVSYLFGR